MEKTTATLPQGSGAESRMAEMLDAESEIYLGELAAFQGDARRLCADAGCPVPPPEELAGFFRRHLAAALENAFDALLPQFLEAHGIPLASANSAPAERGPAQSPPADLTPFLTDNTLFDDSWL